MTNMKRFVSQSALLVLVCLYSSSQARSYHLSGHFTAAPVGHDGRVVDTPEVAQAKAAHLAAFSRLARAGNPRWHNAPAAPTVAAAYGPLGAYSNPGFFSTRVQHGPYDYRGPPAPLAHDGRVLDTPEVAHAKAAHFAAFNQAASRSAHYDAPAQAYQGNYNGLSSSAEEDDGEYRPYTENSEDEDDESGSAEAYAGESSGPYRGPLAPLAEDGRVLDTPEVAKAKAAHLAAFHRASQGKHGSKPYATYYD